MTRRPKSAAAEPEAVEPVQPEPSLEQSLARLEEIARRLDGSEIELAEALALYEEGVRLLRVCEGLLGAAETRIQQLRADGEGHRLDPFEPAL